MIKILQNSYLKSPFFLPSNLLYSSCKFFSSETGEICANGSKLFRNWKITRGDKVIMIAGKDKGKTGIVSKVYKNRNQLIVDGINQKQKKLGLEDQDQDGTKGVKIIFLPVHLSNVSLIDPESGKPCRVSIGYLADGKKVRISKKSGAIIEKPIREEAKFVNRMKDKVDGMKDTPADSVLELTYQGEDFGKIKREFEEFIRQKEKKEKLLVFEE